MPDTIEEMVQREKVRQMVAREKARTQAPTPAAAGADPAARIKQLEEEAWATPSGFPMNSPKQAELDALREKVLGKPDGSSLNTRTGKREMPQMVGDGQATLLEDYDGNVGAPHPSDYTREFMQMADPLRRGPSLGEKIVLSPITNAAGAVSHEEQGRKLWQRGEYGEGALEGLRASAQGVGGLAFPGFTAGFTAAPEGVQRVASKPFEWGGKIVGGLASIPQRVLGHPEAAQKTQELVGGAAETLLPFGMPWALKKSGVLPAGRAFVQSLRTPKGSPVVPGGGFSYDRTPTTFSAGELAPEPTPQPFTGRVTEGSDYRPSTFWDHDTPPANPPAAPSPAPAAPTVPEPPLKALPNEMSRGTIIPAQQVPIWEKPNPYTQIDPGARAPVPAAEPAPPVQATVDFPAPDAGLRARLSKAGLTLEQAVDHARRGNDAGLDMVRPADRITVDRYAADLDKASSRQAMQNDPGARESARARIAGDRGAFPTAGTPDLGVLRPDYINPTQLTEFPTSEAPPTFQEAQAQRRGGSSNRGQRGAAGEGGGAMGGNRASARFGGAPDMESLAARAGGAVGDLLGDRLRSLVPGEPGLPSMGAAPRDPDALPSPSRAWSPNAIDRAVEQLKNKRAYGPNGEPLSNLLQDIRARTNNIYGETTEPFTQERMKLSRDQTTEAQKHFFEWTDGAATTPEWAQPLVDAWKTSWGRAARVTNASGSLVVGEDGSTHQIVEGSRSSPTKPHPEIVDQWRQQNHADPRFLADNPGKPDPFRVDPADAPEVAKRKTVAREGFFAGTERGHGYEWRREFQAPNHLDTADSYMHRMSQNAAEHELSQPRYETSGGKTVKGEGLLGEHLDAIKRFNSGAGTKAQTEAFRFLGREPTDVYGPGYGSQFLKGFNRWEGLITATSKLGLSVKHLFTRSTHVPALMSEVGGETAMRAFGKIASKYGRSGEAASNARQLGTIRYGEDPLNRMGIEETKNSGGKAYRFLHAAGKKAGFMADSMSHFVQLAATEAAPEHIKNIQRDLQAGGRLAAMAMDKLTRLDLAPEDARVIDAAGRSGEPLPKLLQTKVAQALANRVNFSAGIGDRPSWMGDPKQAALWRFKGVPIAATRLFFENGVQQAFQRRNPGPLATLVISSVLTYAAREKALEAMGQKPDPEETGFIDAVDRQDWAAAGGHLLKATASTHTAGTLPEIIESPWSGRDGRSNIKQSIARAVTPPFVASLSSGLNQLDLALNDKTAKQYAAEGKLPPNVSARRPAPTDRLAAFGRHGGDLLEKEFSPAVRDAVAIKHFWDTVSKGLGR